MSFVFVVFHGPEPAWRSALAYSIDARREALLATPGCVAVAPCS